MPKSHERIVQERELRRAHIADAAMQLFSVHGFSAVSVEQIAEASGYTRVSVYNHFRGKPMIYLYLVQRGCEALGRAIEARVTEALAPRAAFGAFLDCLIEAIDRDTSFFELYFLERERVQADMSADEVALLEEAHYRVERPTRRMFERGIAAGAFRDVDAATATNLFFAWFAGAVLLFRTHTFRANLHQMLHAVGHYFLRGLEAGEGAYVLPTRALPPPPSGTVELGAPRAARGRG